MTAADHFRWMAALRRLTGGYDWTMSAQMADAWYEQLERYPIDAVEQALRDAPAQAGRFKPTVGMVEQLVKKAVADRAAEPGTETPGVYRDSRGEIQARWRCQFCEDTGWRAKLADSGQLLTQDELIRRQGELRTPRPDGTPTYRMTRCACKGVRTNSGSVAS